MFEEEILTYSAVVEVENFSGSDIVLFFIIIVVLGVVHCSIFKGSYNISNISYLNSPLPLLSFIPLSPISGTVSTGISFASTCMRTHFLHCIHPYIPFPHHLPFPLVPLPPPPWAGHVLPPVLWFCRRKRKDEKKNMVVLVV
jgi:hypothetical protein